jgi:hypothetical protein
MRAQFQPQQAAAARLTRLRRLAAQLTQATATEMDPGTANGFFESGDADWWENDFNCRRRCECH